MSEPLKIPVVSKSVLVPFILITSLFALWGFANDITNPMVSAFKKILELSNTQASWVQAAFYGGYFTMALPSYGGQVAIRMGDWKVVRQNLKNEKEPTLELYNLKYDPTETKNIADLHPEILQKAAEIFSSEREIPELENFKIPILEGGLLAEKK